ncbi:hypothetical protein MKK84_24650 [Methylobacterium sp. E-065]|uniref:hypothetical protein n=1 Tax=Methylobacterium sp. E-065 TaxID=2836583 RepID=UPI001FBB8890|nr:hypothetical protein [Methylobacterium sp. E-065]MCJ2020579.1 hypothetical protein [Methylobacterium sp. E-065]
MCEVKVDSAWQRVTAVEAHAHHRSAPKRCPECHGVVLTASNYTQPIQIRLSHRKAHDGCPLLPNRFRGVRSPHPQAMV